MAKKSVGCKDIGFACDFVSVQDTDDEVMSEMAEHASSTHEIPVIPPHVKEKLQTSIIEVEG